MTQPRRISNARARRIALAAQGFADPPPGGKVTAAHVRRVIRRIGLLQLDSVNVLVRAHYLPLFARLGPYPQPLIDDFAHRRRQMFEYWGHVASLMPVELFPLFRHRMTNSKRWRIEEWAAENTEYVDAVLAEVGANGPLSVSDLEDGGERGGTWWGWSKGKVALEYLFNRGLITTAHRTGFSRYYDLTERVIPRQYLDAEPPDDEGARRELLLLSARHHGIGTAKDLADYYRLSVPESRKTLAQLTAEGAVEKVEVPGWRDAAYLHPESRMPRRISARALLSPFDSLVWERDRTERLFGFRYRIEIYTPPPKRIYGYYVLPFLLGEELVARVDLKSDRQAGRLLVKASHAEEGVDHAAVAPALAEELQSMAGWLGLTGVDVADKGDLAPALRRAS